MDRRIFIGGTKQLPALRVVAQNNDAPQTSPMQALVAKRFAHFVDKRPGQKIPRRHFANPLLRKGSERPEHPLLHRQSEPGFRTIVNRRGKKVATRLYKQSFRASILFLYRDRETKNVFDQLMIEKWHPHF